MKINNNNILKYITIIFFFGFIYLVPIITLSTPDKKINEIENKILTPLPKLNFNTVIDKSFMEKFDKYSGDQFPLRTSFLEMKNIYSYIIGNRNFRDIYITNKNRLLEKYTFDKSFIDKNISQVTKISNYLQKKHNINSTLMVIPTSIAFYENELPSWAISDNQEVALNYINSKIENDKLFLEFYTPYDVLKNYKDSGIYFNTDHHWTQLGARISYEDFFKEDLPHEFLNYDKVTNNHYGKFFGTYYSKALLPFIKGDDIYAYKDFNNFKISIDFDKNFDTLYDSDKLNGKNKYQYFLHGDPAFAVIEGNDKSDDEILIFKDSYAHSFIPFLTSNYKKIHVVDPRYYKIDLDDYLSKNKFISKCLFINNIQTFSSNDMYNKY